MISSAPANAAVGAAPAPKSGLITPDTVSSVTAANVAGQSGQLSLTINTINTAATIYVATSTSSITTSTTGLTWTSVTLSSKKTTVTGLLPNTAYWACSVETAGTPNLADACTASSTTTIGPTVGTPTSAAANTISVPFTANAATQTRATCTSGTAGAVTPVTAASATSPISITATGGASYTCTVAGSVTATSPYTYGAESTASTSVTVTTAPPGAPTGLTVTSPSTSSLSVAFTAGNANGSNITNYEYSTDGGTTFRAFSPAQTSSPVTISTLSTGVAPGSALTGNTSYTIALRAVNGVGTSASSATATGATRPNDPALTLTPGNAQISVALAAKSGDGAATLNRFRVACALNAAATPTTSGSGSASSPVVVSSLTNGSLYKCVGAVSNDAGTTWSADTVTPVTATPATVPGAPTGVGASSPTASQLTVSWTAPTDNGGAAVSSYTATAYDNSGVVISPARTCTATAPTLTCNVGSLTSNKLYKFAVTATNSAGTSAASSPLSTAVATLPAQMTTPSTPTRNGSQTLSVAFTAYSGGDATVNSYQVACTSSDGGASGSATGSSSPISVGSLTNGKTYTCTVAASNDSGVTYGQASSASGSAIPATTPGVPSSVSGGSATAVQLTVTWSAPTSDGGATITGYSVQAYDNGGTIVAGKTCSTTSVAPATPATSCNISGLDSNKLYKFTVTASNAVGSGTATSLSSAAATLPAQMSAPSTPTRNGSQTLSVAFTGYSGGDATVTSYQVACTSSDGGASGSAASSSSPISVGSLTNGKTYTCTVAASNTASAPYTYGTASSASGSAIPATTPGVPTISSVTADSATQLTVKWSAPGSTGGASISDYEYSVDNTNYFSAGTDGVTGKAITGLSANTNYTVYLRAKNAVGSGTATSSSKATLPGTTTVSSVTKGNAQISVAFDAYNSGDATLSNYQATCVSSNSGVTGTGTGASSPIVVSSLTNGKTYTCTVKVQNASGYGSASAASDTAIPSTIPAKPSAPTTIPGPSHVTVEWTEPDNSGSAITGYTVQAYSADGLTALSGKTCAWSGIGTLDCDVENLTNGTAYKFTVTATNANGSSLESDLSASATPANVPDEVHLLNDDNTEYVYNAGTDTSTGSWEHKNASVKIYWTLLPNTAQYNGGSSLIGYTVQAYSYPAGVALSGKTCETNDTTTNYCTVLNLTNGTAYTFGVVARNAVGQRTPGAYVWGPVTPSTTPGAPTIGTATRGDQSISIAFTPTAVGSNGGATITDYEYQLNSAGAWASLGTTTSPGLITGLTNGTSYTVKLRAVNLNGSGTASSASNSVTAAGKPIYPPNINVNNPNSGGASNKISISWGDATNPNNPVGSPYDVTAYDVQAYDGSDVLIDKKKCGTNGAGRSCTITFANSAAIAIKFCVTATNGIGTTTECSFTIDTGTDAPGPVSNIATKAGNGGITVSFSKPTYTGVYAAGGAIPMDYYTVTARANGVAAGTCTVTQTGKSNRQLRCNVTGLTNGTGYIFYIKGCNTSGKCNTIAYYTVTTPSATLPGSPTSVLVRPGSGIAVLTWSAPSSSGSTAITGYGILNEDGTLNSTVGNVTTASLTGLSGSAPYVFYVYAINNSGASSGIASLESTSVSTPPTSVTATGGNGKATVSWSVPVYSAEYSIAGYTVTSSPSNKTCTWNVGDSMPMQCEVTGLGNGTGYTFSVVASNSVAIGTNVNSLASSPSSSVIPGTTASAPTGLTATAGNGQVSVAFTPGDNGGYAVTNYKYSLDGGTTWIAFSPTQTTSPVVITGLTNGTSYTVMLKAVNGKGDGTASTQSDAFTPQTDPAAPTNLSVTRGNGSLDISFTAGNSGGGIITNYEYQKNDGSWEALSPADATSPVTVPNLQNGTSYKIKLRAVTATRTGASSSAVTGTPSDIAGASKPGAPTIDTIEPGNQQLTVTFDSGDNGGVDITNYKYSLNGGAYVSFSPAQTSSPVVISGLTNGTAYSVRLRAVNTAVSEVGDGDVSNAASGTPATAPGAPTIGVTRGNGSLSVSFSGSASNGSTITDYEYALDGGQWISMGGTSSPFTVSGLSNGTTYNVKVRAVNGIGSGTASSGVNGTPSTTASAPLNVTAVRGNTQATVAFDAPSDNGGAEVTDYEYQLNGSGGWTSLGSTTSPVTITGLTNGSTYTVKLRAVNVAGSGAASDASNSFVPATNPSAPTLTSITRGDGQLTVNFTAPNSDGGETITGYDYSTDGGSTWTSSGASTSPVTITGLTNGNPYSVQLRATTANFNGTASNTLTGTPSASVSPTAPDAPQNLAPTVGNNQVSISFDQFDDGGSPITKYQYSYNGVTGWNDLNITTSPAVITGLSNGTAYTVYLRAVNSVGAGSSTVTESFTPATVPGAPTIGDIKALSTTLQVKFTSPADNGGSPITDYEYSLDGTTWSSAGVTSPFTISSLTANTSYTLRLRAKNSVGSGSADTQVQSTSYACGNGSSATLPWSGRWKKPSQNLGPLLNGTVELTDINCSVTKAQIDEISKSMLPIYASWNSAIGQRNGYVGGWDTTTTAFAAEDTLTIEGLNADKGNGKHVGNASLQSVYVEGTVNSQGTWIWVPYGCSSAGNRPVSVQLNNVEMFKLVVRL